MELEFNKLDLRYDDYIILYDRNTYMEVLEIITFEDQKRSYFNLDGSKYTGNIDELCHRLPIGDIIISLNEVKFKMNELESKRFNDDEYKEKYDEYKDKLENYRNLLNNINL